MTYAWNGLIFGAAVLMWLVLASTLLAQPYMQWNNATTNSFEGHFVYVDGNGNIQTLNIGGVGGYLPLNYWQANGRLAVVVPTFMAPELIMWQGQGIKDPFDTSLNEQIGPTFQPQAAPAMPSTSGENWTFFVRWDSASVADAQAKGIDDQLPFNVAVFTTAKKRTDGVPMKIVGAAESNYADSSGSVYVTVPNVQYFDHASTASRMIFGGKATVQGTGRQYTARLSQVLQTPAWPGPLDYATYTVKWVFD